MRRAITFWSFANLSLAIVTGCGDDSASGPGWASAGASGSFTRGGVGTATGGGPSSGGSINSGGMPTSSGGSASSGGSGPANSGGSSPASGGSISSGGMNTSSGGSANFGGSVSSGGVGTGGGSVNSGGGSTPTGAGGTSAGAASGGRGGTGASGAPVNKGGSSSNGGGAGKSGSGGSAGAAGANAKGGTTSSGGAPGTCQILSPPSEFVNTIDLTWKEMTGGFEGKAGARGKSSSITNFRNAILDQVMETGGTLNYCVRYESTVSVSTTLRDKIQPALQRGVDEWFAKLNGHNCFPHSKVVVKVVGWAVRDRATLAWSDTSVPVYINDIFENAPQCAQACGRFFHQQAGYAYPNCPGGTANHYDMSLWLTEGMNGGAGGDWGQRVGRAYFTDSVDSAHQHIWLHEFGHGFGFPDYYEWDAWTGGTAVPNSVMVAGLAPLVTDWDGWMLRHLWNNVKSRWP